MKKVQSSKFKNQNFGLLRALIFAVFILNFGGCGSPKAEKYGEEIPENSAKTAIGTILSKPDDYVKKDVIIEGQITSECPAGGWINVSDTTGGGTIYVELQGTSIMLPQEWDKNVVVKGTVYHVEGELKETRILAKGLVIK